MRFTVKRTEFLKALLIAGRAVNSKSLAVPVLANLKLTLNDEGLFVTGSNYDFTIQTKIPYTINDVEVIRNIEEGEVLTNTKYLTDTVRKADSDEITLEIIDSTIALVTSGKAKWKLNCIKADEYPDIDLDQSGVELNLTKLDFNCIVSQTAFAASTKEQRPALTALHMEAKEGVLTTTALDGSRMAKKYITIPSDVEFAANVPAKMMVEIDRLLENSSSVKIFFTDKKALFSFENTVVVTRLIAGQYPGTDNIIPRVINHVFEVNASDLMKAIDRVNIFAAERENVVDLTLTSEYAEVSAKSSQNESASERIENFKFDGEKLHISFNCEFVLSAVRALNSEDVTFMFVSEIKPFVVKNIEDESVVQIVTPVNRW